MPIHMIGIPNRRVHTALYPIGHQLLADTHRSVAAARTADGQKAATAKNYAPSPAHDPKPSLTLMQSDSSRPRKPDV